MEIDYFVLGEIAGHAIIWGTVIGILGSAYFILKKREKTKAKQDHK